MRRHAVRIMRSFSRDGDRVYQSLRRFSVRLFGVRSPACPLWLPLLKAQVIVCNKLLLQYSSAVEGRVDAAFISAGRSGHTVPRIMHGEPYRGCIGVQHLPAQHGGACV